MIFFHLSLGVRIMICTKTYRIVMGAKPTRPIRPTYKVSAIKLATTSRFSIRTSFREVLTMVPPSARYFLRLRKPLAVIHRPSTSRAPPHR